MRAGTAAGGSAAGGAELAPNGLRADAKQLPDPGAACPARGGPVSPAPILDAMPWRDPADVARIAEFEARLRDAATRGAMEVGNEQDAICGTCGRGRGSARRWSGGGGRGADGARKKLAMISEGSAHLTVHELHCHPRERS